MSLQKHFYTLKYFLMFFILILEYSAHAVKTIRIFRMFDGFAIFPSEFAQTRNWLNFELFLLFFKLFFLFSALEQTSKKIKDVEQQCRKILSYSTSLLNYLCLFFACLCCH